MSSNSVLMQGECVLLLPEQVPDQAIFCPAYAKVTGVQKKTAKVSVERIPYGDKPTFATSLEASLKPQQVPSKKRPRPNPTSSSVKVSSLSTTQYTTTAK
ncbi:hypothetical protein SPRG_14179 [Saprolegnia parasitica CBS 223.65]|uniref:Uncharacterized protein n=1 Tax=Saprolegnia parasitica (strain CBS 223.65) TaxID=695850 RepID=A0A067C0D5_SAPPC|nr:hypothetical protein SPRG_14179 [Saprolegnia parasitica CBS 223.65]KDO20031.1 hypothetical protein SPRG_14179 [Saprolegnia parasitica CBS 223.65]|eukprot:XP_012209265.1 hypothetical protein SPRG_14179 [Saprolegnia parasitica CBS 223.65]